jgi:hypothetical protein
VDDAPHTTCTSPDYVPSAPIVIVQLPCRDAGIAAATPVPDAGVVAEAAAATSFTTATYRRAVHGRKEPR